MSRSLALQAPLFDGHPVRCTDVDGRPWFVALDLAEPLGIKRHTLRERVAELDPEDKGVGLTDTLGGRQEISIVSESGAIQLVCQSRKPAARRLRKFVADLAVAWNRGELTQRATPAIDPSRVTVLEQMVAAQTTALQALLAQQQALSARLLRVEHKKVAAVYAPPVRRPAPVVPQAEIDAFEEAWRKATWDWERVSYLAMLCEAHNLLPTLLGPCHSERSRTTVLGKWLHGRPNVEHHRSKHRRAVRLQRGPAVVIEIGSRRSS